MNCRQGRSRPDLEHRSGTRGLIENGLASTTLALLAASSSSIPTARQGSSYPFPRPSRSEATLDRLFTRRIKDTPVSNFDLRWINRYRRLLIAIRDSGDVHVNGMVDSLQME